VFFLGLPAHLSLALCEFYVCAMHASEWREYGWITENNMTCAARFSELTMVSSFGSPYKRYPWYDQHKSEVSNRVLSGKSFVPACKYILTRWYVCSRVLNPSSGKGVWGDTFCKFVCPRVVNPSSGLGGLEGRQKMSVILSVSQFVCPRLPGPGRQSPDFSPQSFSVPP